MQRASNMCSAQRCDVGAALASEKRLAAFFGCVAFAHRMHRCALDCCKRAAIASASNATCKRNMQEAKHEFALQKQRKTNSRAKAQNCNRLFLVRSALFHCKSQSVLRAKSVCFCETQTHFYTAFIICEASIFCVSWQKLELKAKLSDSDSLRCDFASGFGLRRLQFARSSNRFGLVCCAANSCCWMLQATGDRQCTCESMPFNADARLNCAWIGVRGSLATSICCRILCWLNKRQKSCVILHRLSRSKDA